MFRTKKSKSDSQKTRGSGPPMAVAEERQYKSGISDTVVAERASDLGAMGINDKNVWGDNSKVLWFFREIAAGHEVNAHLIGHVLRSALGDLNQRLNAASLSFTLSVAAAKAGIDAAKHSALELERFEQKMREHGATPPQWLAYVLWYGLALAALVLGDWAMQAVTFSIFGGSDQRVAGIPFTDDVHLAASAAVVALVLLAHFAGKHIRTVTHDLERLRTATDEGVRSTLPRPSKVSVVLAAAYVIVGLVLLVSVAYVRGGYLASRSIDAHTLPFLGIQLAVFGAALALSIAHANPHGREYVDLARNTKKAEKTSVAQIDAHAATATEVNSILDDADTLLAQAGHHFGASFENVKRQQYMAATEMQRGYPEPVSDNVLLPDDLPSPKTLVGEELAKFLVGIKALTEHKRASVEEVAKHRDAARAAIEARREAWRQTFWPPQSVAPASDPEPNGMSTFDANDRPSAAEIASNGASHA